MFVCLFECVTGCVEHTKSYMMLNYDLLYEILMISFFGVCGCGVCGLPLRSFHFSARVFRIAFVRMIQGGAKKKL